MKTVPIKLVLVLLILLLAALVALFVFTMNGAELPSLSSLWEGLVGTVESYSGSEDGEAPYPEEIYEEYIDENGEVALRTVEPTATPRATKKTGGIFSFLKKNKNSDASGESGSSGDPGGEGGSSGESGDGNDTSATLAPGTTATPRPSSTAGASAGATAKTSATAAPGTSASPGASASTKVDTGKLTPAQVAGVLNQAFALQGLSSQATAVSSDSGVTVRENTGFPYMEYQQALQNDPNGEATKKATSFLSGEISYWDETFATIRAQTGYTGGLSLIFVFSDGVEYTGI